MLEQEPVNTVAFDEAHMSAGETSPKSVTCIWQVPPVGPVQLHALRL